MIATNPTVPSAGVMQRLRLLVTCCIAAVPSISSLAVASAAEGEKLSALEVEAVAVLRTLRDPRAPGPEIAGPRIGEFGPEVVDCLFEVLETRRVPATDEGESQQLSEPQARAVQLALEGIGRETVLATVELRYAAPENPQARAAAIAGVGAVGKGQDLDLLLELVDTPEEGELDPQLAGALREAITAIVGRDVRALPRLESIWSGLPEVLLPELVQGVGASGDSQGLEFLEEIYTWNPSLEYLVSTQIMLLGPADRRAVNQSLAGQLQNRLRESELEDARAACLALGVLEDFRCVPTLIELLDDPREGVRANAHWALCHLTGKRSAPSGQVWQHWYDGESKWFEEREARVLSHLGSPEEGQILNALREIAGRHLHRHQLALKVTPLLRDPEARVRRTAASVLSDLGSRWAVADLIEALDDPDEGVRVVVAGALAEITGERREASREAWADYPAPEPESFDS